MSKVTRTSGVKEGTNESKGQVEVTIVRSRPVTASSEATGCNKIGYRSINTLGRIDEQVGNRVGTRTTRRSNKNTGCPSKFNMASPESFYSDFQRQEFVNRNPNHWKYEEANEIPGEIVERKPVHPNAGKIYPRISEAVAAYSDTRRCRPLVELEALHRVLDKLRPDDSEFPSAWYSSESCCREIVLRFQNLLTEWAANQKIDDCLAMDDALKKCEHCGVIKYSGSSRNQETSKKAFETTKETTSETRSNERIMTPERESDMKLKIPAPSAVKSVGKTEIMRNSYPAVPPRKSDVTNPRSKLPLGKICSNPVAKTNSTKGSTNCKISKQSSEKSASRTKETTKINDSHEPKKREVSKNIDSTLGYCGRYLEETDQEIGKESSNPLTMDTVKYLAQGNFAAALRDDKSRDSTRDDPKYDAGVKFFRKPCNPKKNHFDLHGSRDTDFHQDRHFFICDGLRLSEDEHTERRIEKEDIRSKTETLDMSEDAASVSGRNVQLKASGTSTFSSSSAENMIRRWIKGGNAGSRSRNVVSEAMKVEKINETLHGSALIGSPLRKVQSIRDRINEAIQKFANRADDQPKVSSEKKPSDDVTMIKPPHSMNLRSSSTLSVMSSRIFEHQRLSVEASERFERQILYDEVSSRDTISEDSITATSSKVLLMYRKILESNEEMDWESFEQLVSALHPTQRELWYDICRAISNEAKRVADMTGATTEVCIEINPLPSKLDKQTVLSHGNEITFELDMIVKDANALLMKKRGHSPISKKSNKEKNEAIESGQQ